MNEKMQLIIYSPSIYPCQTGGFEVYNHYLAKALENRNEGRETLVFTTCPDYLSSSASACRLKQRLFGLRRFGLGGLSSFLSVIFHSKVRSRQVVAVYTSYVGAVSFDTVCFLLLMKFLMGIPYILHIHGGGMREWKRGSFHRTLFRQAKKVAGVSPLIAETYAKRSGRPVDLLLPIVPFQESPMDRKEARAHLGLDSFDEVFLFVGSIKELKAPEMVLKAFLELEEEVLVERNPGLVFCGDGDLREPLIRKYKDSPHFHRVIFKGRVPNASIPDYYRAASLYVISSWFEGTPISLMQAMHAEVPSIGTRVRGIDRLIADGHTGWLVEKDDVAALGDRLHHFLKSELDVQGVSRAAKESIDKLVDYDRHVEEVINYISGA